MPSKKLKLVTMTTDLHTPTNRKSFKFTIASTLKIVIENFLLLVDCSVFVITVVITFSDIFIFTICRVVCSLLCLGRAS